MVHVENCDIFHVCLAIISKRQVKITFCPLIEIKVETTKIKLWRGRTKSNGQKLFLAFNKTSTLILNTNVCDATKFLLCILKILACVILSVN